MFPHVKVPPHKPNNLSTMPRTHRCAGHSWAHLQSQHSGSEVGGRGRSHLEAHGQLDESMWHSGRHRRTENPLAKAYPLTPHLHTACRSTRMYTHVQHARTHTQTTHAYL